MGGEETVAFERGSGVGGPFRSCESRESARTSKTILPVFSSRGSPCDIAPNPLYRKAGRQSPLLEINSLEFASDPTLQIPPPWPDYTRVIPAWVDEYLTAVHTPRREREIQEPVGPGL